MSNLNQVRIIGGRWKSRKIHFPELPGIRPTPDRVRETLFNWLSPYIIHANCLDLFAGSGALGFEALSRGASGVTFVDNQHFVLKNLEQTAALLDIEHCCFVKGDVPKLKLSPEKTFDIVFVDPPYDKGLIKPSLLWLESHPYLSQEAYIYVESSHQEKSFELPDDWQVIKADKAGQCYYQLIRRSKV